MNLLDKVCATLKIETEEEWAGNDGDNYMLADEGYLYVESDYGGYIPATVDAYSKLLRGELRPIWKPKKGDLYYVPFINAINNEGLYDCEEWGVSDLYDQAMLERGLVFKTEEEAKECSRKILQTLKGESII